MKQIAIAFGFHISLTERQNRRLGRRLTAVKKEIERFGAELVLPDDSDGAHANVVMDGCNLADITSLLESMVQVCRRAKASAHNKSEEGETDA